MPTRVMVFANVDPTQGEQFEQAYRKVSAEVLGTAGHVRDELLKDVDTPGRYILLSEWVDESSFRAWEDAPIHRELTTPMRPYWVGRIDRHIYEVAENEVTERPAG